MKVAKFTASIMRVDVPFVTRYRDISGGRLYTVTSKLSRRFNGSQVQFETQLLQLSHMYRVLQKQEIVWDSDVPLSRPGSTSGVPCPINFPNFLGQMIRMLVGVDHSKYSDIRALYYGILTDDEVSDDEVSDDEVSDDEVSDDEVSDDGVSDDRVSDNKDSDDRKIIREFEQHFARMAIAARRDGSQCSLSSASDYLRSLINGLDRSLGDDTDLFCVHDPSTQVNSVGYGSTPLEPGDHILPVGDIDTEFDFERLMEVFILRKSCSIQVSDEEKPVYRLVGRGYIFDPTVVLLRRAKKTKDAKRAPFRSFSLDSLGPLGYRRSKQTVYLK
jgi:hypothetical protein